MEKMMQKIREILMEGWVSFIKFILYFLIKKQHVKSIYEIIGIENSDTKDIPCLILRLENRFIIKKTVQEIIADDAIIDALAPRSIRAITYMAVLEKLSPNFHLISYELNQKIQEYTVTLRNKKTIYKRISASQISKNKALIKELSAEDANRIGYMAGINDTLKDQRA